MEVALAPGARLGNYQVVSTLGEGGMGVVYEARHERLRQRVALKVLEPRLSRSEVLRERMIREGRAVAKVSHPHIVGVHDAGFERGYAYLVMELLEGEDLAQHLKRHGALTPSDAVDLLLPVTAALEAAHRSGIVHRDLKPSNVFLTRLPSGAIHPKVVDFGISKLQDATLGLTGTAEVLGTPLYMAPEQIEAAREVDCRADVYALGVMLYECVTGQRPFGGAQRPLAILHAVSEGKLTPPRQLAPELPRALEKIILRCMERDPGARYATALELADALLPHATDAGRTRFADLDPRGPGPATRAGLEPPDDAPTAAREGTSRGVMLAAVGVPLLVVALAVASLFGEDATYPVSVTTSPVEAEILLDGELVGTGAFDRELPEDGARHTLVVRAAAHRPFETTFTDAPPPRLVTLEPLPTPEPPEPEPSEPEATESPEPVAAPRPRRAPRRAAARERAPAREPAPTPEPAPEAPAQPRRGLPVVGDLLGP
ncbi:MAG: serine/threonine-protein kinase [Myxococcota bacterium]|nr:serine/threonine-protein kinase [Myxococcota bacterium]